MTTWLLRVTQLERVSWQLSKPTLLLIMGQLGSVPCNGAHLQVTTSSQHLIRLLRVTLDFLQQ